MIRGADMRPPTKRPCSECPWRRTASRGWLGPLDAGEWVKLAQSDHPIACHTTIPDGFDVDADDHRVGEMRQCAGAAIFRSNICKSPRDDTIVDLPADRQRVFARPAEFIAHHVGS